MPRLTDASYLLAHAALHADWLENGGSTLSHLPYKDQRNLHDYFTPDDAFDAEQLVVYRKAVTKRRPSLAQEAGKSYAKFSAVAARPKPAPVTRRTTST